MRLILFLLIALSVVLALTNPNEAEFRAHMQQKYGIAGSLSLKVAAIFSAGTGSGCSVTTTSSSAATTSAETASCRARIWPGVLRGSFSTSKKKPNPERETPALSRRPRDHFSGGISGCCSSTAFVAGISTVTLSSQARFLTAHTRPPDREAPAAPDGSCSRCDSRFLETIRDKCGY
jgi:hypothetical protein